jgi:RHS repeat-associated protein
MTRTAYDSDRRVTATYTYDALNRLTREQVSHDPAPDYATDYTLDLVGNRTKKLTTKGDGSVERVEGTFDARDRLTQEQFYNVASGGTPLTTITYDYDPNGSLTTRQNVTTGDRLTQVWDVRGRLQSATNVQGSTTTQGLYRYDPDGLRLREEVTTTTNGVPTKDVRWLVIDHQSPTGCAEVLEERPENPQLGITSYVFGSGLVPISMARPGQPVGLFVADVHSGVRQVVDLTGATVLATKRYDGYGVTVDQATRAGGFVYFVGYRGERENVVTQTIYLRGRDYDPKTGLLRAVDPEDPDLYRPLTGHRYVYAVGDPANHIDPSGYFALSFGLGSFFSSLGSLARTHPILVGGAAGCLFSGGDALVHGASFTGTAWACLVGGVVGASLGGLSSLVSTHALRVIVWWAFATATAAGVTEDVLLGNYGGAGYRLFAGALAFGFLFGFPLCFVAGTAVLTYVPDEAAGADWRIVPRAIEQLRVGQRVPARKPQRSWTAQTQPEPDFTTWKRVRLRQARVGESAVEMELLRPATWIEKVGARVGATIGCTLPEAGICGRVEVVAVEACPMIPRGPGRVVTGTFRRADVTGLVEVAVAGLAEPIVGTEGHPFWSEDRQDYIPAAQLHVGERMRMLKGGTASVARVQAQPGCATVYNIEVQGEHVYYVSELGLLVHNICNRSLGQGTPEELVVQGRIIEAMGEVRQNSVNYQKNFAGAEIEVDGQVQPPIVREIGKKVGKDPGPHPERQIIDYVNQLRGQGHNVKFRGMVSERNACMKVGKNGKEDSGCDYLLGDEMRKHGEFPFWSISQTSGGDTNKQSLTAVEALRQFWTAYFGGG